MKKTILTSLLILGGTSLFAQEQKDSIWVQEIPIIKNNVFRQRQEINALTERLKQESSLATKNDSRQQEETSVLRKLLKQQSSLLSTQNKTLKDLDYQNKNLQNLADSLKQLIALNNQNIIRNSKELGTKIQQTGATNKAHILKLDNSLDNNRLYWMMATLGIFSLGGLVYYLLGKRIKSSKIDVETQLKNTKSALEEEAVKLDTKLVDILNTQLKIKEETSKKTVFNSPVIKEKDHSLALKIADEVIRIQKNLGRMDTKTKGLKQLTSSVKRIQDNFMANDYELVDMIGKEYKEGMKVIANFVPSEDLKTDEQIITRIIKPQVNFKGTMIQSAQIEVSIGE